MSYSLSLSNGAAIPGMPAAGLQDGTVDSMTTSLSLVGKNYPGYGKLLNENFIFLLENFANSTSPTSALPGQLWWDSSSKLLKVNAALTPGTSAVWKPLATMITAPSVTDSTVGTLGTPSVQNLLPVAGDQWWDTVSKQLKVFTGVSTEGAAGWVTVGPINSAALGQSGTVSDTIMDVDGVSHVVIKFFIGSVLSAVLSNDAVFTPKISIPGFTELSPGFNLTTLASSQYNGTATSSMGMIVDGVQIPSSSFIRSDVASVSSVGLTIASNDGVKIGIGSNLIANVNPLTSNAGLYQTISNKDLTFYVNHNNSTVPVIQISGATGTAEVFTAPTTSNGIVNKSYLESSVANVLMRNGSTTVTGSLVPSANATINLGSSAAWFNNIYGTSMQAKYADLAERFAADAQYSPGTVVELGGTAEITAVKAELSDFVLGVISTNAAYLMNAESGNDSTHPPVAIGGRVPVNVLGKVSKGDRLVSAGNGLARAAKLSEVTAHNVIGRSLVDKYTDGIGLVESIVRINT